MRDTPTGAWNKDQVRWDRGQPARERLGNRPPDSPGLKQLSVRAQADTRPYPCCHLQARRERAREESGGRRKQGEHRSPGSLGTGRKEGHRRWPPYTAGAKRTPQHPQRSALSALRGPPCQERPRSPGTGGRSGRKDLGKLIRGEPVHNGADFAPSKDRALLIIQGTVQLCKSVGSLCPTTAFCRGSLEGDGEAQNPSCWIHGDPWETPSQQKAQQTPAPWPRPISGSPPPHRGLSPGPGELTAILRHDSENPGCFLSKNLPLTTCCSASNTVIQSLLLYNPRAGNSSKVCS